MHTSEQNELSNFLTGQDIKDYLSCGGSLEQLNEIKGDFSNWADATAQYEWNKREEQYAQSENINLFTSHPY